MLIILILTLGAKKYYENKSGTYEEDIMNFLTTSMWIYVATIIISFFLYFNGGAKNGRYFFLLLIFFIYIYQMYHVVVSSKKMKEIRDS